jgi:hypothetical protein
VAGAIRADRAKAEKTAKHALDVARAANFTAANALQRGESLGRAKAILEMDRDSAMLAFR